MAMSGDGAFAEAFRNEMKGFAREALVEEFAWIMGGSDVLAHPKKQREAYQKAQERVDAMTDKQVMEFLHATAPKGCPECGR